MVLDGSRQPVWRFDRSTSMVLPRNAPTYDDHGIEELLGEDLVPRDGAPDVELVLGVLVLPLPDLDLGETLVETWPSKAAASPRLAVESGSCLLRPASLHRHSDLASRLLPTPFAAGVFVVKSTRGDAVVCLVLVVAKEGDVPLGNRIGSRSCRG